MPSEVIGQETQMAAFSLVCTCTWFTWCTSSQFL